MTSEPETNDALRLHVNGEDVEVRSAPAEVLVDTLHTTLGLTSVRGTCGLGICGTCTVVLDGKVTSSCLTLTAQAEGREVTTSEGLVDADGTVDRVQQAFLDHEAYQCSFCIPGMVLTVRTCLEEQPGADLEQVREYLGGNLCRCGTYGQILEAVAGLLSQRDLG